jgi:hypothetical protein
MLKTKTFPLCVVLPPTIMPFLQHNLDTYRCCFGPDDNSENLQTAASVQASKRDKATESGRSIKRGCQASFRVAVPHEGEEAQIRVVDSDWDALMRHNNSSGNVCHGPDCQNAGKYHLLS